jgi:UrcA family protein
LWPSFHLSSRIASNDLHLCEVGTTNTSTEEIAMKAFATIAAVLSLSVLSSAHADSALGVPSVTVHFADLDLTRTEGHAALYQRLTSAARSVCQGLDPENEPGTLQWRLRELHNACINQAIAGAIAKIDRPTLTAYAATKMTLPTSKYITLTRK